jgi:predicted phosphoribosyltransferase
MVFKRYESRFIAGEILADYVIKKDQKLETLLKGDPKKLFFCFAIPNGGVPVAEGFSRKTLINYDLLIVRKIKIPYNTEAGFGSVTTDGTILLNDPLLEQLNLTQEEIKASIEITKREIEDRLKFYDKNLNLEEIYRKNIEGKYIFMIDDGLASGFTMLAAVKMIKKYNPQKIYIAVPTAPLGTVERIKKEVDEIFCPNVRNAMWFAVADAYKNWYDVPESEVLEIIKKSNFILNKKGKIFS